MNGSMFKVLFDYNGQIDNREFLYCIYVISFFTSIIFNLQIINYAHLDKLQSFGSVFYYHYYRVIIEYIPEFIPYNSLIFYCCMNITIKRFRSLNANKVIGVILGFLIFMGFKSFIGAVHFDRIFGHGNIIGFIANVFDMFIDIKFLYIWFIPISILIIALLSIPFKKSSNKKTKYSFSFKGELSDIEYISHIIRLFVLAFVPIVIFLSVIYTSFSYRNFYYSSSLGLFSLLLLIYFVILIILYINVSVRRIRNIGFKGRYVPIVFILSLISIVISGVLMSTPEIYPINYMVVGFFVIILTALVQVFNVLLLLLPEGFKNRLQLNSKEL